MNKKIILSIFLAGAFCILAGGSAIAQETATTTAAAPATDQATSTEEGIVITPQIIDIEGKAREIFDYKISIKNNTERKAEFYALVNDLTEEGKQEFTDPSKLDKATSLARWIKIKRGALEIGAGQELEVDLKVEVNLSALPGTYHAMITFGTGSNPDAAEAMAEAANMPKVLINAIIGEEIVEKAEIERYATSRTIYYERPISFSLDIKNLGNRPVTPAGVISIYDRRGKEVGTIDVKTDGPVNPEAVGKISADWNPQTGVGKYRAKLMMEYGNTEVKRDLSDAIDFWLLPLRYIVIAGVSALVLIILLTILIFRRTYHYHHPVHEANGVIDLKNK